VGLRRVAKKNEGLGFRKVTGKKNEGLSFEMEQWEKEGG